MFPKARLFVLSAAMGIVFAPAVAAAQAPPQPKDRVLPPKTQSGPTDCVHTRGTVGEGGDLKVPEGYALSQQLARSNGVICPPPQVDPEMKKPAPGGRTMPVVPPPGSPEGRKRIQPK